MRAQRTTAAADREIFFLYENVFSFAKLKIWVKFAIQTELYNRKHRHILTFLVFLQFILILKVFYKIYNFDCLLLD